MSALNSPASASERVASTRALWECCAWIGLWIVARGALLLALCDVFVYGEEMEKACAGKALLDGLDLPRYLLAYHPYEGGGFVVSHLDALSFALIGESVLAIKLVALAFGAAILFVGWRLTDRCGGRAAARAFALMYVFAPESVQANSLLALGVHYQALLFVGLVLLYTTRVTAERCAPRGAWIALGLSAGFGLYFSYQLALTITVAALAVVVTLRRSTFRSGLAWSLGGALIGASPLLWMASHVGSGVLEVHGAQWLALEGKGHKLTAFFSSLFTSRTWWDCIPLVALALAPCVGLWAARRGPARFSALLIGAHVLLFVAAYLASGFTIGEVAHYFYLHRLTPLWFLAITLLALGVGAGRGAARRSAIACVAVLAASGVVDTVRLVRDAEPRDWAAHFDRLAHTKGYRYSQYLQKIEPRIGGSRPEKLARLLHFRESAPAFLHDSIGIALYGSGAGSFEDMCAEMRAAGVGDLAGFYRGLGLALLRQHVEKDVKGRIAVVTPFPAEIRDPLIEGIGRFGDLNSWEISRVNVVLDEARAGLRAGLPESYFVGLGRRFYDALGDTRIRRYFERRDGPVFLDVAHARRLLGELPAPAQDPMRRGFEAVEADRRR